MRVFHRCYYRILKEEVLGFWLQAGSVSGRVQDIGFMQTKVQGFDGVPVLVPNQAFTSQVSTFKFKVWYFLGVFYQSPV